MSVDITISKNLVLKSGSRYCLGTVPFDGYASCGLLNPELWYQNECYFLDCWARKVLDPFSDDEDNNRFILTMKSVQNLLASCIAIKHMFDTPGHKHKHVLDAAAEEFHMEEWCIKRYAGSGRYGGDRLAEDVGKVLGSITCILGDIESPDVEYHLHTED